MADVAPAPPALSVNRLAWPLAQHLVENAAAFGIVTTTDSTGVLLADAGVHAPGSVAAGLALARIGMGGLGRVDLRSGGGPAEGWPTWIDVTSSQPVVACLASQYAGWNLVAGSEETGGRKFFALGSGPARALAGKEALFAELGYRDAAPQGCLVLEVDRPPPAFILHKVLGDCGLQPGSLVVLYAPTASLAGITQVVARVLEVALHKAHVLGFALHDIVEGTATAPLPPPPPDALAAMGRSNDAILYGGRVHLTVRADDERARALALALPSSTSRDYGRPFAEIFAQAGHDFHRIDPALFAPAEVSVSALATGNTWHAGRADVAWLRELWLREAA